MSVEHLFDRILGMTLVPVSFSYVCKPFVRFVNTMVDVYRGRLHTLVMGYGPG